MQNHIKRPLARLMALTLTAAMLIGMAATASAAPRYPDIAGHWGEAAIERWSDYDVLHGTDQGLFDPNGALTVTQLAQILVNAFGYAASYTGELPGYSSSWGEDAVRKAIAAGALTSSEASLPLTRELSAKIIAKAFGIAPVSGASKFADDYAISAGYKPYAAALGRLGFFNGNEFGEFTPARTFSRAQIMQVLDNAVTDIVKEDKAAQSAKSVIVNKAGITLSEGAINGDLIIAQGVGDGDVTLDGVTVQGRLVIFGGGANSIHVKGKSSIPSVVVGKTFGQAARFVVESADAVVGTVTVLAESKAAVATTNDAEIARIEVEPTFEVSDTGEVVAAEVTAETEVTISAKAAAVEVAAENTALTLSSGAVVDNLTVETKAAVTVASGATVTTATVEASDVTISGAGKVEAVTVTEGAESGVEIKTPGTTVTVDENAGTVTTSTGTVESGKSSATSDPPSSPSGGGGGNYTPASPSFTLSVGLSPAQAGWPMTEGTAGYDAIWNYYPYVDSDSSDDGTDAISVNSGWIDGSDGYTQAELTVGGGAIHYFVKVVYRNYTWNEAASALKLALTPKGDGTGSIDIGTLTADRFFHDAANKTLYYFGGATIATGLGSSGTAPWLPNARFASGAMSVTASIAENSTTKITAQAKPITWPSFEYPTLTENATIPEGAAAVIPSGKALAIPENKALTVVGTLTVDGILNVSAGGHLAISSTPAAEEGSRDNVGLLNIAAGGAVNVYGILSSAAGYVDIAGTLNFGNGNGGATGAVALNVPGVTISGSGKIAYTTTYTDGATQWARLGLLDSSEEPDSRLTGGLWQNFGSVSESNDSVSLFTSAWKDVDGKLTAEAAETMGYHE